MSGPPVVIYGISMCWKKDTFRTSLLAYFLALSVIGNLSYILLGMVNGAILKLSGAALIPALLAAWAGINMKNRVSEGTYRKFVIWLILAVALVSLMRSIIFN